MDSTDTRILKFLTKRENFAAYKSLVLKGLQTKEALFLLQDFEQFYKEHPTKDSIDDDFSLWFRVDRHPDWKTEKHGLYTGIVDNLHKNVDMPDTATFLASFNKQALINATREKLTHMERGVLSSEDFILEMQDLNSKLPTPLSLPTHEPTELSLSLIHSEITSSHSYGLFWRTEELNKSIGPLRKGDFVVVAKRPECGGTSFLMSEMSFMLHQLPEEHHAVVFNNEEDSRKVYPRMINAALNVDYRTLMTDPAGYDELFEKWKADKQWDLVHDTSMTVHSIENQLKEKPYGLIGVNIMFKVGGTGKQEDHDHYEALGKILRRIAQEHGPVIAIVQADPSAENMRFIPKDRIYKSKTAVQGEADALIMLGRDEDGTNDDTRYLYVAKNKMPPAPCTVPAYKHGKFDVAFNAETSRFTSKMYASNSIDTEPKP